MKKTLVFLLALFSTASGLCQIAGYRDFELVESTPIETNLDNTDIRDTHDVWLEMINDAQETLDIEQMYISTQLNEPLEDILLAISAAGQRGVNVRIIVDLRMARTYPAEISALEQEKNVNVRIININKLTTGIQHAKFFIVDNKEIFLGSQNFDWRALKHIHELGLRIRHSEAVKIYRDIFELDWQFAEKNDPAVMQAALKHVKYQTPFHIIEEDNDTLIFTPTMSPKGYIIDSTLWDEPNIVSLIDGASTEVVLQFLSYSLFTRERVPYTTLDSALRRAAQRGVNVKLIVSDWGKATPSEKYLKDLSTQPNIEVKFSSIPDYSKGYIPFARVEHCKFIVADGKSFWLGTSNAEKNYFHATRNVGVMVQNKKLASILQKVFMKSWSGPYTELIRQHAEYQPRKHGEN